MQPMCLSPQTLRMQASQPQGTLRIISNAETQLRCVYFLRIGVLRKPVGRVARGIECDGQ